MSDSTISWARDEFGRANLGDARRTSRLVLLAAGFADRPAGKVTEPFSAPAERRAVYRLMDNDEVSPDEVMNTSCESTVRRCDVLALALAVVPVDGSSLNVTDDVRMRGTGPVGARSKGARGFQVMTAIGVAPDGTPLGLLGQTMWSRPEVAAKRPTRLRSWEDKETKHWVKVLDDVRARFDGHGTRPWFQLDRGGDAWPVLEAAHRDDVYVTVRSAQDRRLLGDKPGDIGQYLWETLRASEPLGQFNIDVVARAGRAAREATMTIRSRQVVLETRDALTNSRGAIPVWAVFAIETGTTPAGEKPLEWMLLTTRPADTFEEACTVVLAYTYRWKIEEFHKVWKTGGCNVEDTQLQSAHGIQLLAVVLASVAMRLLRIMWLSRKKPAAPATVEFSQDEIEAVYALKKVKRPARDKPSISKITLWIAELGGYTGKSSGGPPGVITLGRGWAQVEPVARVLHTLRERGVIPEEFEK